MLLKHTIISRLCGCCMPLYLPISVSFCMRACERMWSCQVTYIHCSFPPFCLRPRAHHWLQGWCHRSDKGTSLLRHSHMHRQKHNHPEIHVSTWRHTWADWRHRACNVRDSVRILCSCGFHLLIPFVLLSVKEVSAVIVRSGYQTHGVKIQRVILMIYVHHQFVHCISIVLLKSLSPSSSLSLDVI